MKIPVCFADGTLGDVNSEDLDNLLREKGIVSFQREGEWVKIGIDALRDSNSDKKHDGENHTNNANEGGD